MAVITRSVKATLGFVFTPDLSQVILIEKHRPRWQDGRLNGLGGKVEGRERWRTCLSREVFEEANLHIPTQAWQSVGKISLKNWRVQVFAVRYDGLLTDLSSKTDEPVAWYSTTNLPPQVMPNLNWLVPLAKDCLTNIEPPTVSIKYPTK